MTDRENRRLARLSALWTLLGAAFVVAAFFAFLTGRLGLGIAFLVGLTLCLGGLTRVGRARRDAGR